jgi:hypothetical protein
LENNNPLEKEQAFNRQIIAEYLRFGSVDKVFENHHYDLPISYPGFQRLVDKWGIVKAAGPNSLLSEALCFMVLVSDKRLPLEKVYRRLPHTFKTSMATMHRIMHHVKEGVIRRFGTAVVITSEDNPEEILIGEDVATPRIELGKPFGALTLPMGYSKEDEEVGTSILRVMQQEVFVNETIDRKFPHALIPNNLAPFMYLDVADVRVAVYHLVLPNEVSNFSSFKVINHRFLHLTEITSGSANFRTGIKEIGLGYKRYLEGASFSYNPAPVIETSLVNLSLADLALQT